MAAAHNSMLCVSKAAARAGSPGKSGFLVIEGRVPEASDIAFSDAGRGTLKRTKAPTTTTITMHLRRDDVLVDCGREALSFMTSVGMYVTGMCQSKKFPENSTYF